MYLALKHSQLFF